MLIRNSDCCQEQGTIFSRLTDNSVKFWDADVGPGWRISIKDTIIREYTYDYQGKRIWNSHGDVIIDTLNIKLKNEMLILYTGNIEYQKYKIIRLTSDSLIVFSFDKPYGKSEVHFSKSKDQKAEPSSGMELNPDTSTWKVKVIKK